MKQFLSVIAAIIIGLSIICAVISLAAAFLTWLDNDPAYYKYLWYFVKNTAAALLWWFVAYKME